MTRATVPRGATRRLLLGPPWLWAVIIVVIAPLALALAAWGGAFGDGPVEVARQALRVWAIVLFSACVAWLALVVPGVLLSTITARRRGTPGLVGQGVALFWAGMTLVAIALAASLTTWFFSG